MSPGTAGVGREAILQFAKHNPKHIYFTGRNASSANSLITSLSTIFPNRITFIPCDQTSLSSVSQTAKTLLEKSGGQLDILVCNAGVMAIPTGVSKDGYEIQFAINHLAHALLIKLCLPALLKAREEKGDARIVILTSLAFKSTSKGGIIFKDMKSDQSNLGELNPRNVYKATCADINVGMTAKYLLYGQSKLANVLYASQLAKLYPKLTVTAVHPGLVAGTSLADHMGLVDKLILKVVCLPLPRITLPQGAYNILWAATSMDKNLRSGGVYEPVGKPVEHTKLSADQELGKKLCDWTEKTLSAY